MGIKCRDSLSIGVEAIDSQNKELLVRFDRLLNECEEGQGAEELKKLLAFMEEYVHTHFRDKEALQRLHRFPGYMEHCAQHAYYIAQIKKLRNDTSKDGFSVHHIIAANNLLLKWLLYHIFKVDKELGEHINYSPPN